MNRSIENVAKFKYMGVEVRWRCLFRSTFFLGKRWTSYNAPPTSRKCAVDRWSRRNFLPRSSLFMVGKSQKSHGARSELNSVFGLEKVDRWNPFRTSAIQCLLLWGNNIKLRVYKKIHRELFWPKKGGASGQFRILSNKNVYGLYWSHNFVRLGMKSNGL
jgi:hypothetical protein